MILTALSVLAGGSEAYLADVLPLSATFDSMFELSNYPSTMVNSVRTEVCQLSRSFPRKARSLVCCLTPLELWPVFFPELSEKAFSLTKVTYLLILSVLCERSRFSSLEGLWCPPQSC